MDSFAQSIGNIIRLMGTGVKAGTVAQAKREKKKKIDACKKERESLKMNLEDDKVRCRVHSRFCMQAEGGGGQGGAPEPPGYNGGYGFYYGGFPLIAETYPGLRGGHLPKDTEAPSMVGPILLVMAFLLFVAGMSGLLWRRKESGHKIGHGLSSTRKRKRRRSSLDTQRSDGEYMVTGFAYAQ